MSDCLGCMKHCTSLLFLVIALCHTATCNLSLAAYMRQEKLDMSAASSLC